MMREGPQSVVEMARMYDRCPAAKRFMRLECCETYDEFVELVCGELDDIFRVLERNKQLHRDHSEDALTNFIVTHLDRAGFVAEQGVQRAARWIF